MFCDSEELHSNQDFCRLYERLERVITKGKSKKMKTDVEDDAIWMDKLTIDANDYQNY